MVTHGVVWRSLSLLLLFTYVLWSQFVLIASADIAEAFQNEPSTSPVTMGPEVVPQLPTAAALAVGTGPALGYTKEAETRSDAVGMSTMHDNQPTQPADGAAGSMPIPTVSIPELQRQCEESPCSQVLQALHKYNFGPNKFLGVSVLFLAAAMWLVYFSTKNLQAMKEAKEAYHGALPHCSTLDCASHVLNIRARSSLLLLLGLPFWRGLALAGSLRMVFALPFLSKYTATDGSPRISGLLEIFTALGIIMGQEAPSDFLQTALRGDALRNLAPGLLLIGLLLCSLSLYEIAQWKKQLKAERRGQRGALRLGKLPKSAAEGDH